MYLSRIEMTGFKSFADKTVIEFDKGMTAVVGPNGSGKSNLSEAIRWVLGEQSAKSLRGNKMEDVIFNGTQERKAVNLAKVTLVLNNEDRYLDYDFSEISITRSYNRNGESAYYINNEAVRLKDIVDLLLDSGLGKNSFAMISQGKVESIFLNKPEERRSIFEEAAGVQKYQFRKQEASRKMLKSQDHLSRVKDIIHELESQLKPLKRQRESALRYLERKDLLKHLEISLYAHQIQENRDKWEELKQTLTQIQAKIREVEQILQANQTQLQAKKSELDTLLIDNDALAETIASLTAQQERHIAKSQMIDQQIQFDDHSSADKKETYEENQRQYDTYQADIAKLQSDIQALTVQQESDLRLLSELKAQQERLEQGGESAVQSLNDALIEAYRQEAAAKNQLSQSQQSLTQSQERLTRLSQQRDQDIHQLSALQAAFDEANTAYAARHDQAISQRQHFQQYMQELQQLQAERQHLQQTIFKEERQLQQLSTRVQSLRQAQEEYAGYYGGVRTIMKQANQLYGIEGTVGDFIDVPSDYQLAIDTALGAAVQHIIVQDDRAAREAIQLLKQQNAGRATFLPRPHIRARVLQPHHYQTAQTSQGFIGIASDIVSYVAHNDTIIKNLLGNTVVCDTIMNAQQLAKQLNHQVKIVTLEGDILMPGGAITGGRNKHQGNAMLSRQHDLTQAQTAFQEAQQLFSQLEMQWQTLNERVTKREQEIDALREHVNREEVANQQLQAQFMKSEAALKAQQRHVFVLEDDIAQLTQRLSELVDVQSQAQAQLHDAQHEIVTLTKTIAELTSNAQTRQTQLAQMTARVNDVEKQHALNDLALQQAQTNLTQRQNQLDTIIKSIEVYQQFTSQNRQSREQLQQEQALIAAELVRLNRELADKKAELAVLRESRSALNQLVRELDRQQADYQKALQSDYQQQAKVQAQVEKYASLIDTHLIYLNTEYQLSFEAAQQQAVTLDNVRDTQQQVQQIKRSIEQLGPINLEAIDDYEQLHHRYTDLVEQETDLLTAMNQLQETMDEMDKEVIHRFSETFNQINHQFQKTFKKLFAGGEASLQLTDPSDLLTTGVDIIAQPPGKRKQHLALLSGGERAFTAIALLFAILETRPVPFCVLDEVEAALDDANVYRYGQYLHSFTKDTQFIVITHRKGTMENADVLYGVTMEKSGISKLASVRLSEAVYE